MSHQASTNLEEDPPYTPQFGASVSPFEFFDFTYDSRTDLRRHYATYQADWRPATGGRFGDHQVTTAVDWDGERGTLTDALAQTEVVARRDNVGWTLQHQALWPRLFATVSVRVEHNDSFGTATVPRVAAAFVARQSRGAVGETRLKASAGRGIKEPTIVESYSPDAVLPRQSGSRFPSDRAASTPASSSGSRTTGSRSKPRGSTAASGTSSRRGRSASTRSDRSSSTSARRARAGSSSRATPPRSRPCGSAAATRSCRRA